MKRNHVLGIIAVAAITAGAFIGNRSIKTEKEDTMLLANVEALTQTEGQKGTGECYNTITNKKNSFVLYCGNCTWTSGAASTGSDLGYCN